MNMHLKVRIIFKKKIVIFEGLCWNIHLSEFQPFIISVIRAEVVLKIEFLVF
jgi:hypothetical protein